MISIYHASYPAAQKVLLHGVISYSHETLLVGGYRSAAFSFNAGIVLAEEWFYTGVGRHIAAYSEHGNMVWEGVVNEVSFNVGPRAIKIGPFLDISNRINVGFQYPNYGVAGDPLSGTYAETGWNYNQDSQIRYGILEEFMSGGSGEYDSMIDLRNNTLVLKGEPGISEDIGSGSEESLISISVSCIGYTRVLEKQVYNLEWQPEFIAEDLSVKVSSILDANQFFVNAVELARNIQPIDVDVYPEEEKNRTAWGIISDHVAKSNAPNDIRCGIFSNMAFVLEKVNPDISYRRRSGSSVILDMSGNPIENSELIPGSSMITADFSVASTYRINSIKYDLSGNTVSLNFLGGSLRNILSGTMLGGVFS